MTEASSSSSSSRRIEESSFAQPAQEKEQVGQLGTEHTVKKSEESAPKMELEKVVVPQSLGERKEERQTARVEEKSEREQKIEEARSHSIPFPKQPPLVSWAQREKSYVNDLRLQVARQYVEKKDVHPDHLKHFLSHEMYEQRSPDEIERTIKEALDTHDGTQLLPLLEQVGEHQLGVIVKSEELLIPLRENEEPNRFSFSETSVQALGKYVHDPEVGFSGVVALQDKDKVHPPISSEGVLPTAPFCIHSVGKVFTGVLALRLIKKSIIDEDVMEKPVEFDQEVLDRLPKEIRDHFEHNKPSLHQLLIHRGGLGDYLEKYFEAMSLALKEEKAPKNIENPEDFLQYVEEKTFPTGEFHYSNAGILLAALSIQHYARKRIPGVTYKDLLEGSVIVPAKMQHFSSIKPPDGSFNTEDREAGHMCGSPAGGYWTTAEDLCSFGRWISKQWRKERFRRLVETYGQEFYKNGKIVHSGVIDSASAFLCIIPEHNVTVVILSNKRVPDANADDLYEVIKMRMMRT